MSTISHDLIPGTPLWLTPKQTYWYCTPRFDVVIGRTCIFFRVVFKKRQVHHITIHCRLITVKLLIHLGEAETLLCGGFLPCLASPYQILRRGIQGEMYTCKKSSWFVFSIYIYMIWYMHDIYRLTVSLPAELFLFSACFSYTDASSVSSFLRQITRMMRRWFLSHFISTSMKSLPKNSVIRVSPLRWSSSRTCWKR